jgi:prepilin-type N-terminal cleavage/methylation domain-containing protein
MNTLSKNKGFTLLELLVVIAILAVLAAVTVVVINPAELLARARDTQRINDLAAIRSAIGLYMTEMTTPSLGPTCTATHVYAARAPAGTPAGWTVATTTSQVVTGAGWIRVNLAGMAIGSPLAMFPVDPTNSSLRYYLYACRAAPALGFALVANLESATHTGPEAGRTETRDGGLCADLYETGTIGGYLTAAGLATLFGVTC